MLTTDGQAIIYRFHGETVRVEALCAGAVRVSAWQNADTPPDAGFVHWNGTPTDARVEARPEALAMHAGAITARVTEQGVIGFYRNGKLTLEENARLRPVQDDAYETRCELWPLRRPAREWHASGGGYALSVRFTAPRSEKLYGMGQYPMDVWNLKGASLELMNRNAQSPVPFVLSSAGYGFLWNSPAVGRAAFSTNETVWESEQTNGMDYVVLAADTPKDILNLYAKLTGFAPEMPAWALGFWQSKLRYKTQKEVLAVAERYAALRVPLAVIVIDFFHWTNLGEWMFDETCFPDPAHMVARLHELGTRVCVSVWPHVAWNSKHHNELYERDLLMKTNIGCDMTDAYGGASTYLDLTHPEAQAYLRERIREGYETHGVDFYWLDEAEPELPQYEQALYRYRAGPARETGGLYCLGYAKTFAQLDCEQGKPALNLIRCAAPGSQRLGALVWSGDIPSAFAALRIQVRAGQHMGLAGIPWWTHDIGGFRGGDITDADFRELLIRWFAFGAFSPVMRLHGHRLPMTPEEQKLEHLSTGADNEIWSYGASAQTWMTAYIRIRERLKPYLERAFLEASQTGLPVMRALFLQYPHDDRAWDAGGEYMLGCDLLVAPVTERGVQEIPVYLPSGDDFVNVWTGEPLAGGQTVSVDARLPLIPVFACAARFDALDHELSFSTWREGIV